MYRSFRLENFQGLKDLEIKNLARINLIAGANNVGKTSVLEGLFLHAGAYNLELLNALRVFRGIEAQSFQLGKWAETPWDAFFHNFQISEGIRLTGKEGKRLVRKLCIRLITDTKELPEDLYNLASFKEEKEDDSALTPHTIDGVAKLLELESQVGNRKTKYYILVHKGGLRLKPLPPPPPFPATYITHGKVPSLADNAGRLGNLIVRKKEKIALEALKVIEPALRSLTIVPTGGTSTIHGDIGLDRLLPLALMGGGMTRLASYVLAIGNSEGGVVLIDEIESGLHYSVLPQVWKTIEKAARDFNVQVFATTHSLECIEAAHQTFKMSDEYDFRLHRLDRVEGAIRSVTYEKDTLEAASKTDLEVR